MTPREKKELELPVPQEIPLPQGFERAEKRDFPESLIIIAKHKRLISYFVISAAVLSVVISLLLPKYYSATAKMLPPQQSGSVAAAVLSQLGGLGSLLGGGAGKDLGLHNPN